MQIDQKPPVHDKSNGFALNLLKGSIGQAIVETFLLEFGYEVYPYGYENNYANITRYLRKDCSDTTTTKIRAMPDLIAFDRDRSQCLLLQIKTTSTKDQSKYWIRKDDLDTYIESWPEALLLVYCIRTTNIYCCRIGDFKDKVLTEAYLRKRPTPGYYLDLSEFFPMTKYFGGISPHRYEELRIQIANILRDYSACLGSENGNQEGAVKPNSSVRLVQAPG